MRKTSLTLMRPAPVVKNPVTPTPTEMSSTPRPSSPPSTPLTSSVPSTIRSTLCSIDSKTILKKVLLSSSPTRSKPLLIPPSSRSSPRLRSPDSKLTSSRDKLTSRSSPSTLRLPSSPRLMLGSSPDNLTKMLLTPRTTWPPKAFYNQETDRRNGELADLEWVIDVFQEQVASLGDSLRNRIDDYVHDERFDSMFNRKTDANVAAGVDGAFSY